MGLEFERKFIFDNANDVKNLLDKDIAEDKITKIEQSYLNSKYANLIFNINNKCWDVSIKIKNNENINFSVPIESDELKDIYSILEKNNYDNLLDIPQMSSRIRFKGDKTLFTAKFKPFFEFEPQINLPNNTKEILLKNLPSITKLRYEIIINGYNTELDIFLNNESIPILELEFSTKQEMLDFNITDLGLNLTEVTSDDFYRNINIANRNFK